MQLFFDFWNVFTSLLSSYNFVFEQLQKLIRFILSNGLVQNVAKFAELRVICDRLRDTLAPCQSSLWRSAAFFKLHFLNWRQLEIPISLLQTVGCECIVFDCQMIQETLDPLQIIYWISLRFWNCELMSFLNLLKHFLYQLLFLLSVWIKLFNCSMNFEVF